MNKFRLIMILVSFRGNAVWCQSCYELTVRYEDTCAGFFFEDTDMASCGFTGVLFVSADCFDMSVTVFIVFYVPRTLR